ncbi:MAG TPA: TIGR03118 family protein [Planctomycetota bacterium]|nr:TIGR03118 family protein [Planctomycetota bacterium]
MFAHRVFRFLPLAAWLVSNLAFAGAAVTNYVETKLVADQSGVAAHQDSHLVNPWGIAINPANGIIWLSDNGTGVSTLYDSSGSAQTRVVTIPLPPGSTSSSAAPSGTLFNSTTDFVVSSGGNSGASIFIFTTEDGTISGWNPNVDGTHAILAVDNSASGAVYKGIAIGNNNGQNLIYATNFHAGTVDVFDAQFKPTLAGSFGGAKVKKGFAPFGIRNIGGKIYVTYALQNSEMHDDVAGKGNGYVNIYDTAGNLVSHFAKRGKLNSPWGIEMAGSSFGSFGGDILIGNFGDGKITAFNSKGRAVGQLQLAKKQPLVIDGLWGLFFGLGGTGDDPNTLFFTAGTNHEANGLFGTVTVGQ